MRIIFGATSFDHEQHARELLKSRDAHTKKEGKMIAAGIAVHIAHYPHRCDDCGHTYWDTDEWGNNHIGCKGAQKKVGF